MSGRDAPGGWSGEGVVVRVDAPGLARRLAGSPGRAGVAGRLLASLLVPAVGSLSRAGAEVLLEPGPVAWAVLPDARVAGRVVEAAAAGLTAGVEGLAPRALVLAGALRRGRVGDLAWLGGAARQAADRLAPRVPAGGLALGPGLPLPPGRQVPIGEGLVLVDVAPAPAADDPPPVRVRRGTVVDLLLAGMGRGLVEGLAERWRRAGADLVHVGPCEEGWRVVALLPAEAEGAAVLGVDLALAGVGRAPGSGAGVATGGWFEAVLPGAGRCVAGEASRRAGVLGRRGPGVRVDPATSAALGGVLPLRELPGREPTFEVRSPGVELRAPWLGEGRTPLEGREAEFAVIERAIRRVELGEGVGLVLEGPPGVGKSALLAHAVRRAVEAGFTPLLVAGDPLELPLAGWRRGLREALGRDPVREAVGEGRPGPGTAEAVAERAASAIRGLAAAHPVVIAIEDAHWLDATSVRLARAVAGAPGILLLAAVRSRLAAWTAGVFGERLVLGPLGEAAAGRLLARALGVERVPAGVAAALHRLCGGHPLHLLELAASLEERGIVEPATGAWPDPAELLEVDLPTSIEGVVAARIARLPPACRRALEQLAVLGMPLGREEALEFLGPGASEALSGLERAGLVLGEGDRVRVLHRVVVDAACGALPPDRAREVHGRVAAWLADRDPSGASARLAWHLEAAGRPAEAARAAEAAAAEALRVGACREALALLERAPGVEPTPRRWRLLSDARFGVGQLAGAEEAAARCLAAAGWRVPRGEAGWWWLVGRLLAARAGWRLLPGRRPRPDLADPAMAAERMAECRYFTGRPAPLVGSALLAAHLADRSGGAAPVARAWSMLGMVAGVGGFGRLADRAFRRAGEAAAPDAAAGAVCRYAEATVALGRGAWARAGRALAAAEALVERSGDRQEGEVVAALRVAWCLSLVRLEQAEHVVEELERSARRGGNAQHLSWALTARGQLALHRGELRAAVAALQEARSLAAEADPFSRAVAQGSLALARLRFGDEPRAAEEVRAGLERAGEVPPVVFSLHAGLAALAEAAVELAERAARRALGEGGTLALAERAVALLARHARRFPIGRPRALWLRARLDRLAGRGARARRRLALARRWAERLDLPLDRLLLRVESALDLPEPERGEVLAEAVAAFREIGCGWHARQAGRLLRGERL